MKAKFIYENINFERRQDPKKTLGLGRQFGFGSELSGLESNNGINNLYITPEFAEYIIKAENWDRTWLHMDPEIKNRYFSNIKWGHRGKNYLDDSGKYKGMYAGNVIFHKAKFTKGPLLYKVAFQSGDYGFGGVQSNKKSTIGTWSKKSVLEQTYKGLEKAWRDYLGIKESISFERGNTIKSSLGLGGYSFDTLKPGAILQTITHMGLKNDGELANGYVNAAKKVGLHTPAFFLVIGIESILDIMNNPLKDKKIIYYIYAHDRKGIEELQQIFFERGIDEVKSRMFGITSIWFNETYGHMKISKMKFDRRFKIISAGRES